MGWTVRVSNHGRGKWSFLSTSQPPIQEVLKILHGGEEVRVNHSPTSRAKVKNEWHPTSTPPLRLHGMCTDIFTCFKCLLCPSSEPGYPEYGGGGAVNSTARFRGKKRYSGVNVKFKSREGNMIKCPHVDLNISVQDTWYLSSTTGDFWS